MKRLIRNIALAILASVAFIIFSISISCALFPTTITEGTYDCGIILGAAVTSNQPFPVFQARLDHGIDLYQKGVVKILIFTGGVGKGDHMAESEVGATYAQDKGVPASDTLMEKTSKTTIGGTGEKLDKTLYKKSLSGLSDLPITSIIVEEDKHEDSSTITLDKEGKTLVVPVQTKLEEIQKNLEEEGSFVPAVISQQPYAFEQFVEEKRGNQYTEDATFAIILSWTALLSADWTDEERKKLKFGPNDTTSQWEQRILPERRNSLEQYAWKLFEQYSYKAEAPTYNVDS